MRGHKISLNSTRLIRSFNAISVLQALYQEGSLSRARLTELTRMSPATITRIIAELIEQRVIIEERIGESNGGRRPIILRLNYDQLFVVGIQILRDRVALAISDIRGKIIIKKIFQQYSLEPDALFAELASELESLLQSSKIDREYILGIGLAISGIVDSENGVLLRSVNLGWREVKVAEMLEKLINIPVFVENDANAAALAEMWFGGAKDVSSMIYIKTASGVGAGIIYERNPLTGSRGMAGEIGHIPMIPNGRPCRCGQRGCLETYLYLPDVMRRYEEETGAHLENDRQIFTEALNGQSTARQLVDEAIEALSVSISWAEVILDLEMVVIGGIWGSLGEGFLNRIGDKLQSVLERSGMNKTVIIKGSELGEDSDLLGAVGLVTNEWFTPPI
ncbi:MAG: ROK family protein [Bacillota bacterium]